MATLLRALDGESVQIFNSGNANKFSISLSGGNLNFAYDASGATFTIANGTATASGTMTATRFISNIADGTAPLAIISTTLVSNLNVDRIDNYHANEGAVASTVAARDSSSNLTANGFVSGKFKMQYNATTSTLDFIYTP